MFGERLLVHTSSGGTGSRIRMNDSHSYLVLSRTA